MKKDFIQPIVVLMSICMFIAATLAVTNNFTAPVIKQAAAARAEAARNEIIPEASGFELMEPSGLPETIAEVYKTTNDVGYVFIIRAIGYGGDMDIICGIDNDGNIIACKTLAHRETKGLGSKMTEEPFESQFIGKNQVLEGVSIISGATISSQAYIGAINDALAAYAIAKEA